MTTIREKNKNESRINQKNIILLVIAHPDDESMFFIPTIEHFIQKDYNIHILCMSTGDYEGLGTVRKKELINAIKYLGIDPNKVMIVDNKNLQDGVNNIWDPILIKKIVIDYIEMNDIKTVISFDEFGVSKHPNHCAISKALQDLPNYNKKIEVWSLVSQNIIRKYIGIFDILIQYLKNSSIMMKKNSLKNKLDEKTYIHLKFWYNYKAMKLHKSQLVWFRILFILFSSYTFMNILKKKEFDKTRNKHN